MRWAFRARSVKCLVVHPTGASLQVSLALPRVLAAPLDSQNLVVMVVVALVVVAWWLLIYIVLCGCHLQLACWPCLIHPAPLLSSQAVACKLKRSVCSNVLVRMCGVSRMNRAVWARSTCHTWYCVHKRVLRLFHTITPYALLWANLPSLCGTPPLQAPSCFGGSPPVSGVLLSPTTTTPLSCRRLYCCLLLVFALLLLRYNACEIFSLLLYVAR